MSNITRRQLMIGTGFALMTSPGSVSAAVPFDWQPVSPSEAGFAHDLASKLDKLIADKRDWGLHGLIVLRIRQLVLERYFEGEDHARGIGKIGRVVLNYDTDDQWIPPTLVLREAVLASIQ